MESKNLILSFWQKSWWSKLIVLVLGIVLWPLILIYLILKQKWDIKFKLASVVMVLVIWFASTRFTHLNQSSTVTKPTPSSESSQQGGCVGPDGKHIQLDPINCQKFNDAWKNSQKSQQQSQQSIVSPTPVAVLTSTPKLKTVLKVVTTPTSAPVVLTPQTDRASMLVILKANASKEWGDNYEMVKYEYDNQVEAYDWVMAQTAYPDIMAKAKREWGNNYEMVQYEYNNQVEAYKSL